MEMGHLTWLFIAALALLVLAVIVKEYNRIVSAYNGAQRGWAEVMNYERAKLKIISQLAEVAEKYRAFAGNLLENVVKLRTTVTGLDSSKVEPEKLQEIDQILKSIKQGVNAVVEKYPDVADIGGVKIYMVSIVEAEENAAAARTIFNENVERFNNTIQSFPTSLVNATIAHRKFLNAFTDREAEAQYDYKPNF